MWGVTSESKNSVPIAGTWVVAVDGGDFVLWLVDNPATNAGINAAATTTLPINIPRRTFAYTINPGNAGQKGTSRRLASGETPDPFVVETVNHSKIL